MYRITKKDINTATLHSSIYPNMEENYYISEDFSCEFYVALAKAGFISVSKTVDEKQYLIPEIQFEYAVLDFENLHITKKVKKLLQTENLYTFSISQHFDEVLERIQEYHTDNWLEGKYITLLKNLRSYKDNEFTIMSVELIDKQTNRIVAGEIGYAINSTYTSLTGFFTREKRYNNWGKLQLVLLAEYLKNNDFSFWNLGHPYMQYKLDLGASVLNRKDFLRRWLSVVQKYSKMTK